MVSDPGLAEDDRVAYEAHLMNCPKCIREYDQTRWALSLVQQYWKSKEGSAQGKNPIKLAKRPMSHEESWEDLKRRCPSLAEACRRGEEKDKQRRRRFRRVGAAAAVAASIIISVVVGWNALFAPNGTGETTLLINESPAGPEAEGAIVELITPSGKQALTLGQLIQTKGQLQKLLLGDMHWVALSRNSSAKITADIIKQESQTGKLRYKIELVKGQAYAEVVPGHPFMVRTDNALHAIIGTKFSIRTEPGRTDLVVVEGTVKFGTPGSDDKWVNVTAEHTSTIFGESAPTTPEPVDALAATAWARESLFKEALARIEPEADDKLLLSLGDIWKQPTPPDLESISYEKWVVDQRDWFAREFPWAIRVETALIDRGIETDYVSALMISGDIWQFHYPRSFSRPIPEFDPATIEQIAKYYEVDPEWFSKAVGFGVWARQLESLASTGIDKPGEVYHNALRQWQADIQGYAESGKPFPNGLLLFTLRANAYLAKTRTAAYLWARTYPEEAEKLLSGDKCLSGYLLPLSLSGGMRNIQSWLGYFDEQILAAQSAGFTAQELLTTPQTSGCQSVASILGKELSGYVDSLAGPVEPVVQPEGGAK